MKNQLLYSVLIVFALLFSSCDDYTLEGMVDDKIYLVNHGLYLSEISDIEAGTCYISVYKSGRGQQSADITLTFDESLITQYNTQYGTDYKLMPAEIYNINVMSGSMSNEDVKLLFPVKLNVPELLSIQPRGTSGYVIPLKIQTTGDIELDESRSNMLLAPYIPLVELSRTGWEVIDWNSCITDDEEYSYLDRNPEKMLDGDQSTFCGTRWIDNLPAMPYYFIIDMKQEYTIHQIGLDKPTTDEWRGNFKTGYVEISSDSQSWQRLGEWTVDDNTPRTHQFPVSSLQGRYIRLWITDAFEYGDQSIGPSSGARCDIAEFRVWGE